MEYIALIQGVKGTRTLIPYNSNLYSHIKDQNKAWYSSLFIYNEEHAKKFEATKSLSGMAGMTTDKLVFDLDNKKDIEVARKEAIELVDRLKNKGFSKETINVAFSGGKGFSIWVSLNGRLTNEEFKTLNKYLAEGLSTNDVSILDPQRIFRVLGTKHEISNLYKFPLTHAQLSSLSVEEIKVLAKDINNANQDTDYEYKADLPVDLVKVAMSAEKKEKPATKLDLSEVDFSRKPKGFTNCKYAILSGIYPSGSRNNSLVTLIATAKANGFPKEVSYNMGKASVRLQAERYNQKPFSKEELWSIVETVYQPTWNGGQYSCKKPGWLQDFCVSLGVHKCNHKDGENSVVSTDQVFDLFEAYAENYDKNILTTGIASLDSKVKFMVGTSIGILAPPGVGKTSISMGILNHNSKKNISSIFFSFDMFHSLVYMRLLQKHSGYTQEQLYHLFKTNKEKLLAYRDVVKQEYKNVNFCFKSGMTADDIEQTIVDTEERTGEKLKLAVIDYNELVIAKSNDPTQASAEVAQRLRQIANDREICIVTLLQPSKLYSNPSDEITTYQGAKGSGAIAQSLTLMLSLSRPGFNPRYPELDKFFTINALKNRNGGLFTIDLGWEGLTGGISELSDEGLEELAQIRERRNAEKAAEGSF